MLTSNNSVIQNLYQLYTSSQKFSPEVGLPRELQISLSNNH